MNACSNLQVLDQRVSDAVKVRKELDLRIGLSVCLFVCLYVCQYVCMFVCMYVWMYRNSGNFHCHVIFVAVQKKKKLET